MAKRALLFLILLWLAGTTAGLSQSSTGPEATGVTATPDGAGSTLAVTSIVVDESELLEESAVRKILSEYEGKTVSLQDLQRAVDAINQLYAEKGFITAKAILPPQQVTDGIVRVRLVEGRVGDVLLMDNLTTRDSFFLKRIPIKRGDLIRTDLLEQAIARFNSINEVQVRAELRPGKQFGTTDVVIMAQDPPPFRLSAFVDNAGRAETGLHRRGVTVAMTSLLGYQDPFTISRVVAKGSKAQSSSYSFPLGATGTRLGFGYDDSGIKVVSGQFADVEISGHSIDYSLNLSTPLRVTPKRKINGSLGTHFKKSTSKIADTFDWSTTRTWTTVAGISTQSAGEGRAWNTNHDISFGKVDPKDYREPDALRKFARYNGAFTWQKQLEGRNILTLKGSLQLSGDQLLPFSEQFSIGGMSTVRGYPEGILIGDQGYTLGVERTFGPGENVHGFIFLDHGAAFPFKGNNETINGKDFLTSMGIGASFAFPYGLAGKVALGVPTSRGYGVRLHILAQLSL